MVMKVGNHYKECTRKSSHYATSPKIVIKVPSARTDVGDNDQSLITSVSSETGWQIIPVPPRRYPSYPPLIL